jgi:hypothetical protein
VTVVARLQQPAPIRRRPQAPGLGARLLHPVQTAHARNPAARLLRLLPPHPGPLFLAGPAPLLAGQVPRPLAGLAPLLLAGPAPPGAAALTLAAGLRAVRLARLTASSLTARRSLTTRFRV